MKILAFVESLIDTTPLLTQSVNDLTTTVHTLTQSITKDWENVIISKTTCLK